MDRESWLGVLDSQGTAFGVAAERAGLDAPVPSCPGWSVADLVTHLGSVYRYVGEHVGRGVTDPLPFRPSRPDGELLTWYRDGLARVRDVLAGLDPAAPAWNFSQATPKVVGFWPRRMAHETAIHRWDADLANGANGASGAGGAQPVGFGTELAADGVAEVLESMVGRRGHTESLGSARAVVRVGCTDTGDRWLVTLRAGAVETVRLTGPDGTSDGTPDGTPDATVSGPAEQLYLVLWGRQELDTVTVTGDADLAALVRTR